jgi:hypothetical protein
MQCVSAILSSVACPAVHYFSTSYKRHHFRKTKLLKKICVLISSTNLNETFLILRRNGRDMLKNVHLSSRKVPVNLVGF